MRLTISHAPGAFRLWILASACLASLPAQQLVVKQDQTALLARCGEGAEQVAALPQGQPVRLRFSIAGSKSPCYSVSAEIEGRQVRGYLGKDALEGLEAYEQRRRESFGGGRRNPASGSLDLDMGLGGLGGAADIAASPAVADAADDPPELSRAFREALALLQKRRPQAVERVLDPAPADHRVAAILRARALLRMDRPGRALSAVEPALKSHPADADLLALAGISAYQRDDMPGALQYLARSIELRPNPKIERVYHKVKRESEGDKSNDATYGSRFVIRYEGEALSPAAAGRFRQAFEREINRISFELACQDIGRQVVIIQTRENYRNATGAAEWSGGHYDGKIRVVLPPSGEVDAAVRRTLSHEFVHACLAHTGQWPTWLHEGLAQSLSGRTLSAQDEQLLRQLGQQDALPRLAQLRGGWMSMSGLQASVAYRYALAAVDIFLKQSPGYGIRNLINNPQTLPRVRADLDRKVREKLR